MNYDQFKQYMENIETYSYEEKIAFSLLMAKNKCMDIYNFYKQWKKDTSREVSYYMYTFTLRPDASADKAEEYVKSIKNRKDNLDLYELAYSIEHPDTNKHFHVLLGSYRSIRTDAFKQYEKSYGKIKRSKQISKTNVQIVDYISKESSVIWLIKDNTIVS